MNEREILLQQIVADDAGEAGAEAAGNLLRGGFELLRPHVVRRRVDEIARQRCRLGKAVQLRGIDTVGRNEAHVRRLGLAIAAEAVAAEREGERGEPDIVRRIGEAVGARRQQAGQGARPERIAVPGVVVLDAEQHLRDAAVGSGKDQAAARLGAVDIGLGEVARLGGKAFLDRRPVRLRHEGDRDG